MSTVFTFTKRTFSAIKRADPELFDWMVAPHGNPASYRYLHEVGLKTLFEKSGVLDNPGRSPLVRTLVYDGLETEDFKDWLSDGGSPMLSTELKRKGVEAAPILGYRQSVFSSYPSTYPPYEFPEMPMEQWLLGTTPGMVASSILRAVGDGQLSAPKIGKIGIPPGLFLTFKDPQVEGALVECLANQPGIGEKGSFIKHSSNFAGVAFLLMKHGTDEQLRALAQSAAGNALVYNPVEVYSQLLFCECNESEPNLQALVARISLVFGKDALVSEIDNGIIQLFKSQNTTGREALVAFCIERIGSLAGAGKLDQAIGWLHQVVEHTDLIPDLDEPSRERFQAAFRWRAQCEKQLMHGLSIGRCLRFMISVLGPEEFMREYEKEIKYAYSDSWSNVSTDMGLGGVIGSERLPDPIVLKEFGLAHQLLETMGQFWEDHWADNANMIEKQKDLNLSQRMLKGQLESFAKWVGEALTVKPDTEMANRWYDRLEHPFLQHLLVDAMPLDKTLRQRMGLHMKGQQFIRDMGM